MTVSSTILRNDYVGNGSLKSFPIEFVVLQEGDAFSIKVILTDTDGVETIKILNTDYTIVLNTDGTGTVNFITAPPLNYKVTLLSNISKTQKTDYINIGTDKFPSNSHEAALDKLTLIAQETEEQLNRSILLPESSTLTNITIPVSFENVDKAIVVNSAGDNLDAKNLADIGAAPVTDYAKTLLNDSSASEARATLSAQENVITTRGDLIRGSSTGIAERLPIGTNGQIIGSDGTDIIWTEKTDPAPNDNVIINGDFRIWQRFGFGTFSHISPAPLQYIPDRWAFQAAGSGYTIETSGSSNIPDNTFGGKSFRFETTAAKASLAAGDILHMRYKVEGYDYADLHSGNYTVSFYAKTNKSGKYSVSFFNSAHDRIYVSEIEVTADDATNENWVQYTITVTADSSGTWLFDNSVGLQIAITLASGSTPQTSTLNQWQSDTGVFLSSNNQTNMLDAVSNYFELSRVKLEKGSTATDFIPKSIQKEISLCQRYFEKSYDLDTALSTITSEGSIGTESGRGKTAAISFFLTYKYSDKTTTPTITLYNSVTGASGTWQDGGAINAAVTATNIGKSSCVIYNTTTVSANSQIRGHVVVEAEL